VSGQLHAPATLPPGYRCLYPLNRRQGKQSILVTLKCWIWCSRWHTSIVPVRLINIRVAGCLQLILFVFIIIWNKLTLHLHGFLNFALECRILKNQENHTETGVTYNVPSLFCWWCSSFGRRHKDRKRTLLYYNGTLGNTDWQRKLRLSSCLFNGMKDRIPTE